MDFSSNIEAIRYTEKDLAYDFNKNLHDFNPRKLNLTGQNRTATTGLLAPGSIKAGLNVDQKKKV